MSGTSKDFMEIPKGKSIKLYCLMSYDNNDAETELLDIYTDAEQAEAACAEFEESNEYGNLEFYVIMKYSVTNV